MIQCVGLRIDVRAPRSKQSTRSFSYGTVRHCADLGLDKDNPLQSTNVLEYVEKIHPQSWGSLPLTQTGRAFSTLRSLARHWPSLAHIYVMVVWEFDRLKRRDKYSHTCTRRNDRYYA